MNTTDTKNIKNPKSSQKPRFEKPRIKPRKYSQIQTHEILNHAREVAKLRRWKLIQEKEKSENNKVKKTYKKVGERVKASIKITIQPLLQKLREFFTWSKEKMEEKRKGKKIKGKKGFVLIDGKKIWKGAVMGRRGQTAWPRGSIWYASKVVTAVIIMITPL